MENLFRISFGLFLLTFPTHQLTIQDLSGNDWTVYSTDQKQSIIPSRVPGSIYSDLHRAKVLDELYKNMNDVEYRWVAHKSWTFVKTFEVNPDILKYQELYLTCHGLDTVGNVSLNGYLLGSVDNMFVRYRWPVKSILKPTQNVIKVSFVPAPDYARQKFLENPYPILPVSVPPAFQGENHANMIRKMQASFSWDWGPAFPTQGIWKPIVIEAFDHALIRSITVNTIPKRTGSWMLNATIWLEGRPNTQLNGDLIIHLHDRQLTTAKLKTQFDREGEGSVTVDAMIPLDFEIKRWFPNGIGDQNLYKLKVIIKINNQQIEKDVTIGFRTIELVQDLLQTNPEAYSFYFKVNGIPVYSKGSNWIPAHVLTEAVSNEYLEYLLWSAKMANINMLRVWGGGIYETDLFYEIADRYGILIWHDMMFACALYPADPAFLRSVSVEIRQQIRRLQHHPSIALWAGNNENEQAIAQFWWPQLAIHLVEYKNDYLKLYRDTMKPIIEKEDTSRPFIMSSPSNGIISPREGYISSNPQDTRFGDNHYYNSFGSGAWDWHTAPSAKFVSEYGFQSLPSLTLLQKYLDPNYLVYPFNEGLQHRQHKPGGTELLLQFMNQYLPVPGNSTPSIQQLDDFIYLSQVFQAMAIKIETEFYRRNRRIDPKTGNGFTMGALYWQLNNIWPGFSWSSIEYEGRWKMLHYFAKKFFDTPIVDVYQDNDQMKVVIIRDDVSFHFSDFSVNIQALHWSKLGPSRTTTVSCHTDPFQVTLCFQEKINNFLQNANCTPQQCFIRVTATGMIDNQNLTRENFLFPANLKDSQLKPAKIQLKNSSGPVYQSGSYVYDLELTTEKNIAFVWLDFDPISGIFGIFSDNGFIMAENVKIQVKTLKQHPLFQVINAVIIKTLNDFYPVQ